MNISLFARPILTMLLVSFFTTANSYESDSCFTGCQTCQVFFFYVYCTQCSPQYYMDTKTGMCICNPGTYSSGAKCLSCPNYCLTCNALACTTCTQDKYLNNGACLCKNGNGFDGTGTCAPTITTSSIAIILGIAFGATAGLVCIITGIIMIRKKNFRIFLQSPENQAPQQNNVPAVNIQIHRDSQDSSAYGTIILSPKKKQEFKEEICSICLEDFPFYMTQCGHYFHQNCIIQWIKKRHNCPNCNHHISRIKIMKWCNVCRQQLIYPQCYRIILGRKSTIEREQIPIFWPTCANCQVLDEHIDLKPVK